ncbi:hypothetical protein BCR33DRAFT_502637 [Rhizoclosmatium globosum]|uniref:Uncharacterized protein n=1 Tax=Rhizoclosmatium globosum TaxID=329046 RepID=A0A1Y2CVN8_9FUNG|nr:hypothetical protein BCR33DRAFT_502637 [Rhizoclosmatium globosum]|eukprot:ORY51091.1 hypothetical protein BCR33DRAFT_502637 [Rhizoclosmatium globosum]
MRLRVELLEGLMRLVRNGLVTLGWETRVKARRLISWLGRRYLGLFEGFYGMKPVETAKPSRDTPHSPLFSLSVETSTPSANIFYGELSATAKPRRFSKDASGTIREASPPQKYDAKTPFFSRITMSRNLFSETFDEHNISATDIVPTLCLSTSH